MGVLDEVLGSAASGLISGAFGAHQADKNRDFQREMSNTAYRRAARDLEAAGLNRVLALGSPATTPAGVIGSMQMPDFGQTMVAAGSAQQSIEESKSRQQHISKLIDKAAHEIRTAKTEADMNEVKRGIFTALQPLVDKLQSVAANTNWDQFIADGLSGVLKALASGAYSSAREAMADFFEKSLGLPEIAEDSGDNLGGKKPDPEEYYLEGRFIDRDEETPIQWEFKP